VEWAAWGFRDPPFDRGTVVVARKIGELTRAGRLLSVAGGGDTIATLDTAGITDQLYRRTLRVLKDRSVPDRVGIALSRPANSTGCPDSDRPEKTSGPDTHCLI
jgi:hypothetical protein